MGRNDTGKSTVLKLVAQHLNMEVIEINNSVKRSPSDIKKIFEVTQSQRLMNDNSQ